MLFVLAAIGAVAVVVLACFLVSCYLLAETLFGNMAAAGTSSVRLCTISFSHASIGSSKRGDRI
jgi:hypothetical protein